MPLWTNADTVAGKPKIGGRAYNEEYKRQLFATPQGWAKVGAGRATTGKDHEVLVAIRGLSTVVIGDGSATAVKANITSMNWNITTWDVSNGGTLAAGTSLSISANFNEAVTVTGSPTLEVTNGNQGTGSGRGPHSLIYNVANSTANRMTFIAADIGAANAAIAAGDILVVGANKIALAGGGIVGADGQAALYTHAAALPGSITAVA